MPRANDTARAILRVDCAPEQRLAAAVLHQAVTDTQRKGSQKALHYLLGDSEGLRFWCDAAGVDLDALRSKVKSMRRD